MALELPAKNIKVFIITLYKIIKSFQNMSSWQLLNLSGQETFSLKKKRKKKELFRFHMKELLMSFNKYMSHLLLGISITLRISRT